MPLVPVEHSLERALERCPLAGPWGAFSPLDITGCLLWLDAADTNTITEALGSVSQWDDKSGQGNHATQETGALQPTTGVNTLNGRNVLRFVEDNQLDIPKPSGVEDVFVIYKTTDLVYLHFTDTPSHASVMAHSGSSVTAITANFGSPTFKLNGVSQSWSNRGDVFTALDNQSNCLLMKGVDLSSWSSTINLCNYGSGYSITGDIAEVIFYNRSLSAAEETSIFDYAASKWGAV